MIGKRAGHGMPGLERVTEIIYEHILYARRYPERLQAIANRLSITPDSALAVVIADQVCEEFGLVLR